MKIQIILKYFVNIYVFAIVFPLVSSTPIDETNFEHFKALMMYFIEPTLTGAEVRDFEVENKKNGFEGSYETFMASKICNTILKLDSTHQDESLIGFEKALRTGNEFALNTIIKKLVEDKDYALAAQLSQSFLLKSFESSKTIIIPFSWTGHALVLIIKENPTGSHYDLTVVNTGDGLEHHYSTVDNNNVYPFLNRLWIEFKNIPKDFIFDQENYWFMYIFFVLKEKSFTKQIENVIGSVPKYFYTSFLTNFSKYHHVEPDYESEKFYNAQRSGSCALSSIMAAYLYSAKDNIKFLKDKVLIGHQIAKEFLSLVDTKEDMARDIKLLITDGFDLTSRKLLQNVTSGLSHQILAYLEKQFPEIFEHAGLIGAGRSSWIQNKRKFAIDLLQDDGDLLKLVKDTVDLGFKFSKFLSDNPVKSSSNLIRFENTFKKPKRLSYKFNIYSAQDASVTSENDLSKFLKEKQKRPYLKEVDNLEKILKHLDDCADKRTNILVCARDTFDAAKKREWWEYFDEVDQSEIKDMSMKFLKTCKRILEIYMKNFELPNSFDDIVTLFHLQIAIWKSAVSYDNNITSPELKLNLNNFKPPEILERVMTEYRQIISNKDYHWKILTNFSSSNIHDLKFLSDNYSKLTKGVSCLGMTELLVLSFFNAAFVLEHLKSSPENWKMYQTILSHPQVSQKIEEKRNKFLEHDQSANRYDWKTKEYSNITILLSILGDVEQYFPHFVQFVDSMLIIYKRAAENPIFYSESNRNHHSFAENAKEPLYLSINLMENPAMKFREKFSLHSDKGEYSIPDCNEIKRGNTAEHDIFYRLRHSQASKNGIVSFEAWLNYATSSPDATLFDSMYFMYLSDRILNMPIPSTDYVSKYYDKIFEFNLDTSLNIQYPDGFSEHHVEKIIQSLQRLIKIDLNVLVEQQGQLSLDEKSKLIIRALNISVILVKFIGRIDYDQFISGERTAEMLAFLYKSLYIFGTSSNEFNLEDEQISAVNIILTQICDLKIRNSEAFLSRITEVLPDKMIVPLRRTLARYHWFLAKMSYACLSMGKSLLDDLFNNDFIYYPVSEEEIPYMNKLLLSWFLVNQDFNKKTASVKYDDSGELVNIKLESDFEISAQISSGKVIKNGTPIVKKNAVLNSDTFKEYFSNQTERLQASRGEITQIGKYYVFVVRDYKIKENTIVLICETDNCSVYKHYSKQWFKWINDTSSYLEKIKYNSFDNHRLYEKVTSNLNEAEVIMIKDEESKAFLTIRPDGSSLKEGESEVIINIGSLGQNDWALLDKARLERHLRLFTDTEISFAELTTNNALVIIYEKLRLKENEEYPLVLIESFVENGQSGDFDVINSPGTVVEANQVLFNNIGIAGTLIIRNNEGQKYVLVPSYKPKKQLYTIVEKIPLVENLPAPQTRFHRLLLAYYCIKAREYEFSLQLMQPSTSINQNEVLSDDECAVLHMIANINGGGAEAESIKFLAYFHVFINSSKFPLEYLGGTTDTDTEDIIRVNVMEKIEEFIPNIVMNYFMGIREIPEKFYLHRMFPEFLSKQSLKKIETFLSVANSSAPPKEKEEFSVAAERSSLSYSSSGISFDRISDEIIYSILSDVSLNKFKEVEKFAKFMSKFIHRSLKIKTEIFSTITDNEVVIFCAQFDSTIFSKTANILMSMKSDEKVSEFKYELKSVIEKCKKDHADIFLSFDATKGSTTTDKSHLFKTLESDVKISKISSNNEIFLSNIEVLNQEDVDIFNKMFNIVQFLIQPDKTKTNSGLDSRNVGRSKILKKLEFSIENHIKSRGQFTEYEINLSSIPDLLKNLKDLSIYLESRLDELKDLSVALTSKLSSFVIFKGDSIPHLLDSVNRLMHNRKMKTFERLYSCYQQMSPHCIQNAYPQLELKECEIVLRDTMHYYSMKVLFDYLETILEINEKFIKSIKKKEVVLVDDLKLFLDEAAKISNFNERLKQPSILNFEYRSKKYRLREEQVKDIALLSELHKDTNSFNSVVIQRMMAAGKTLVLGTISVVKKALNSSKLSILVPPSSLYQSNLSDMQARTYSYFKTKGHSLTFPRIQSGSDEQLEEILIPFLELFLENIRYIQSENDYYVLSPDSLQSFLNSYIEIINQINFKVKVNEPISDSEREAVTLFAKIYNIFRTQGSIILDEIDMTMDSKKELNFPTTEDEQFNMIAAALSTDLIEFSLFDPNIINMGLDILGNNQSGFTEAKYNDYKINLIDYIKSQLCNKTSLWSKLLLKDDTVSKDKIIDFLTVGEMDHEQQLISSLHESYCGDIADALVIIKLQIHRGLKEAFKSTANLNFGAAGPNRPDVLYAIPYLAANTPSPSSEFSDRWETLNKTLLMLSSSSCPEKIAKNMIPYMKKSILKESAGNILPQNTVTFKNFAILMPESNVLALNSRNNTDVALLLEALKTRSPAAIRLLFSYALDEIFNEMRFPIEQITSNALNMTSMFESVQGYSGTIDNVNILPVEVVSGAWDNHMENEKNNGAIALKLIKDANDENVQTVSQFNDDELKGSASSILSIMIQKALPTAAQMQFSALIDTGAFFKNFKNKDVALAILDNLKSRISAVLYYNEEYNQVEFIRKSGDDIEKGYISKTDPDSIFKATQTDISKRFTFYDQRHITGSDILQPKTARALMTIGTRVLLRDIFQGTLRMRQFMSSQKVHMVTSTSAAQFYFSKAFPEESIETFKDRAVTVSDIIALGAFNEDDKQFTENRKLAFAKINNEIRRFVLESITKEAIIDSNKLEAIISIWFASGINENHNIRDLFIRTIRENPRSWLVKNEPGNSAIIMKDYVSYWIKNMEPRITEINAKFPNDTSELNSKFENLKQKLNIMTSDDKELKAAKKSLLAFLDEKMLKQTSNEVGGGEVEMQLQVQTQALAQIDINLLLDVLKTEPSSEYREQFNLEHLENESPHMAIQGKPLIIVRLDTILSGYKNWNTYAQMTEHTLLTSGQDIGITKDLVQLIKCPEPYKIFSKYTWEGSHILIQKYRGSGKIRAILLSTDSAIEGLKELKRDQSKLKSDYWLCDLFGNITYSTNQDKNSNKERNIAKILPDSVLLIFDILIFNGSLNNILAWDEMRKIYYEDWLKNEKVNEYRAKFLLLRMKVMADKASKIFPPESEDMKILNMIVSGEKDILELRTKNEVIGFYKKPFVNENVELAFFEKTKLMRLSGKMNVFKAEIDFLTIFKQITGKIVLNIFSKDNVDPTDVSSKDGNDLTDIEDQVEDSDLNYSILTVSSTDATSNTSGSNDGTHSINLIESTDNNNLSLSNDECRDGKSNNNEVNESKLKILESSSSKISTKEIADSGASLNLIEATIPKDKLFKPTETQKNENRNMFIFIFGIISIIVVALFAFLILKRKKIPEDVTFA